MLQEERFYPLVVGAHSDSCVLTQKARIYENDVANMMGLCAGLSNV